MMSMSKCKGKGKGTEGGVFGVRVGWIYRLLIVVMLEGRKRKRRKGKEMEGKGIELKGD